MKIIGITSETSYSREYICTVTHSELEKFLALYYDKMKTLKIGEIIDLVKGYDYHSDIASAMETTKKFIADNQKVVTAILNGLRIESICHEPHSIETHTHHGSDHDTTGKPA